MIRKKSAAKKKKILKTPVKKAVKKVLKSVSKAAKSVASSRTKSAATPRRKFVKAAPKKAEASRKKVKKVSLAGQAAKPVVKEVVELPEQVLWIVKCLYDRKADDVRVFDVSQTAGLWEYYVVCSGVSSVHVSALRDNLKKEMGEKGFFKSHEDRDPENKWIVVDFGNILVHIFEKETRTRFALETTLGRTEVSLKGIIKG